MKIENLEKVEELRRQLMQADAVLSHFVMAQSNGATTARCYANCGEFARYSVEVLPVPIENAVSAAQRQRSKIIAELQQLGVEVS